MEYEIAEFLALLIFSLLLSYFGYVGIILL